MNSSRRRLLVSMAAGASLPTLATADSFPSRSVRLVVPFPAGGVADAVARKFAEMLSPRLAHGCHVDNRPGASGNLGTHWAANAPPDGHTLLLGTTAPLATNVTLFPGLPYDPLRDFTPLTRVTRSPMVLVTSPRTGLNTFTELLARLRAQPDKFAYASGGPGTAMHLAGALLGHLARIEWIHVPYQGDAQMLPAILGGEVQAGFLFPGIIRAHLAAGELVPHLVTSTRRSTLLPGVPAAPEAGLPDLVLEPWAGFLAPAGTPATVVQHVGTMVRQAHESEAMQAHYRALGIEPAPSDTPTAFAAFIRTEIEAWGRYVRVAGLRP